MREKKINSNRALAAASGLSLSQLAQAKKEGVDCKSLPALMAFRGRINTRADSRKKKTDATIQPDLPSEMTLEEIETALKAKGISTNDARTLEIQLRGLKQAIAVRKEMNQLLSRAECKEHMAKVAHALGAMLKAYENDIPAACFGKSQNEAKAEVKERSRNLQQLLSDAESEFWSDHPES